MKLSVEYVVLFIVSSFFIVLMLQFTNIYARLHQTHSYLDYAIHLVENYDGQMEYVTSHMESYRGCQGCEVEFEKDASRYKVTVHSPLSIPLIGYHDSLNLMGYSVQVSMD